MLGSNNYLGLTHHPRVLEAASRALHTYGAGCTGSRFLNGSLDLHVQLERALAEFLGKDDCIVFSTGYGANLGMISGILGRNEVVFLDKQDHASIVDGAKLSFGITERFPHANYEALERLLQKHDPARGRLVVVDGVYSMEGDVADIPELVRLCRKYNAALAVDDAHALGVLGPDGDGTGAHFGLQDEVDIIVGTFSKSLASVGGFIAGAERVINYLRHHSRPFIFTAALPPANTAGVLAALEVL
jgi:7-keto-8-aminopelargonate synthetase-like enzyme